MAYPKTRKEVSMGGVAPLETDEKEAKRRLERQSGSSYKGLVDHSKEFGF